MAKYSFIYIFQDILEASNAKDMYISVVVSCHNRMSSTLHQYTESIFIFLSNSHLNDQNVQSVISE